jgi:hypothetical protein
MKRAQVIDEHGFERPMRAVTMLLPVDWQMQGNVQYQKTISCHADVVQVGFRATSADGRFGFELIPGQHWQWSDDPNSVQMLRQSARQAAQWSGKTCAIEPPMAPRDYLTRVVVPRARPNARIVGMDPLPEIAQEVQRKAREQESMAVRAGLRLRISAGVDRVRIAYQLNGQPVEEWLTAITFAGAQPAPTFNMRTGQMGQAAFYNCGAYYIFGFRAPQGQLQSMERFFLMLLSTVKADPEWEQRVTQVIANMGATDSAAAMKRSEIITKNGQEISEIRRRGYENQTKAQDRAASQFDHYIRGVETYRDPRTGDTVELSNQYGHAWANGNGEYVLSDRAGFDPNVALHGNWTQLEQVRR